MIYIAGYTEPGCLPSGTVCKTFLEARNCIEDELKVAADIAADECLPEVAAIFYRAVASLQHINEPFEIEELPDGYVYWVQAHAQL